MTNGTAKEPNPTHPPQDPGEPQDAGSQHARRASALQRMIDIKKSYDFWQELVSKNVRRKLKGTRPEDARRVDAKEASSENDENGENEIHNQSRIDENDENAIVHDGSEGPDFFTEHDLRFLRRRLDEIVSQNGIQLKDGEVDKLLESCMMEATANRGFDPYGLEDEEGLHDGNAGRAGEVYELDTQDDYDVEDLHVRDAFSYEHPRHHHFEVELSDGPPGTHGENEPSCEFTFEYDCDGKLIPTSNNIEEKLRLMNLQSQISTEALSSSVSGGKKKKKSQKKKKKIKDDDHACDAKVCLFCKYEAFYGAKPVYFMKRQDFTHKWEMESRMKIREKLQTARMDVRSRHESREQGLGDESDGSNGTVEDE